MTYFEMVYIRSNGTEKLCLFFLVERRFQQFFTHITTMSGCGKEFNAHFYSAASLKYHAPDT